MDIDYHFDMIKVLACKAGFNVDDAQTIAYACQYVDDANEYSEMLFDNIGSIRSAVPETVTIPLRVGSIYLNGKFNRACTGHDDLQSAGGALVKGQLFTYVPYHFVPKDTKGEHSFNGQTDYRMSPESPIVQGLIDEAVKDCKKHLGDTGLERQRVLIRMGIALHTFIDSWAHSDFSGFHQPEFNTVADMWAHKKNGDSVRLDYSKATASSLVPPTGHAGVHRFPDCSHMRFGWTNPKQNDKKYEHDNPALYMEAAEKAYGHLVNAKGGINRWESIKDNVYAVTKFYPESAEHWENPLHQPVLDEKKEKYVQVFPECALKTPDGKNAYDKLTWKQEAYQAFVAGTGIEISLDSDLLKVTGGVGAVVGALDTIAANDFRYHYKNTDEARKWVLFHLEAWRHRNNVLRQIDMPSVVTRSVATDVREYVGTAEKAVYTLVDRAVQEFVWPVAQELEKKQAWISISLQNSSPFMVEYVGRGRDKGDFDIWVQQLGSINFLVYKTEPKRVNLGYGKYWPGKTPTDCPPGRQINFAACETDNSLNMMTGVAPFKMVGPHGDCDFSLMFTRPLSIGSPTRKLGSIFDHNPEHAYNSLSDERVVMNEKAYGPGFLRVASHASERGKVDISFISDIERYRKEEDSYFARNQDVAEDPTFGKKGRWGSAGAHIHYVLFGRYEHLNGRDTRYWGLGKETGNTRYQN